MEGICNNACSKGAQKSHVPENLWMKYEDVTLVEMSSGETEGGMYSFGGDGGRGGIIVWR